MTPDCCTLTSRQVLATGRKITCTCGAELRPAKQPARRPPPKPKPHAVVAELLAYATAKAFVDSAAYGTGGVLRGAIEGLGGTLVVGRGCTGTVNTRSPTDRAPPKPPSADTRAKLEALAPELRRIADLVMQDGQGYQVTEDTRAKAGETITEHLHPVVWRDGRRELRGPLELRIGWKLATVEVRTRWVACVIGGDKRMAEAGATAQGTRALASLAEAWNGHPMTAA